MATTLTNIKLPDQHRWLKRLVLGVVISAVVHVGFWGTISLSDPEPTSFTIKIEIQDNATLTGLGQTQPPAPKPPPPPPEPDVAPELPPPSPAPEPPKSIAANDEGKVRVPPKPKPKAKPKPKRKPPKIAQKDAKPKKWKKWKTPKKKTPKPKKTTIQDPNARLGDKRVPAYTGEVPFQERDIPSIRSVAPGNAVVTAVVDMRRLRHSPYRAEVKELFKNYPDYYRVVGLSKADPMVLYDRFLVTTANPRNLSETLILGELRGQSREQVRKTLDEVVGEPLTWKMQDGLEVARPESIWWIKRGDPRSFILPADGLVAFAKPELIPFLAARRHNTDAFFPPMPTPIDPKSGALPATLVIEVNRLLMGRPRGVAARLPPPTSLKLVLHDDKRPLTRVTLGFKGKVEADTFVREWPNVQRELMSMIVVSVMGYRNLIGRVKMARSGENFVYLELRTSPSEVRRLIRFVGRNIKNHTRAHHPRPEELPKPPPEKAAQDAFWGDAADAGVGEQDGGRDAGVVSDTSDSGEVSPDRPSLLRPRAVETDGGTERKTPPSKRKKGISTSMERLLEKK